MRIILATLVLALFTAALPAEEYAVLSGTVTDEAGDPLPGAKVQVYDSESPEYGGEYRARYQTVTDETGGFSIENMKPGFYDVICFGAGRVLSFRPDLELFPSVEVNLVFRTDPDAWKQISQRYSEEGTRQPLGYTTLSIIVTDRDGNPIKQALIHSMGTGTTFMTREDGRLSLVDVPLGRYTVTCSAPGYVDTTIEDLLLVTGTRSTVTFILARPPEEMIMTVRKPNIYLYPPQTTEVSVRLELGEGCALTYSDPTYGDGWNVTVSPDGYLSDSRGYVVGEVGGEEVIFDAPRYGYLFYEADAPDVWQRESGWLTTLDVIGDFFASTLREYGFVGREVDDFLEYWTPRLTESLFYAVYPQTLEIDSVVGLHVEPEPDSVLRLFFLIEPVAAALALADWYLPEPVIQPFERRGFAVVEWGVCLDDGLR